MSSDSVGELCCLPPLCIIWCEDPSGAMQRRRNEKPRYPNSIGEAVMGGGENCIDEAPD